jgi:hypothetical protein
MLTRRERSHVKRRLVTGSGRLQNLSIDFTSLLQALGCLNAWSSVLVAAMRNDEAS